MELISGSQRLVAYGPVKTVVPHYAEQISAQI